MANEDSILFYNRLARPIESDAHRTVDNMDLLDDSWSWWNTSMSWRPPGADLSKSLAWLMLYGSGIINHRSLCVLTYQLQGSIVHWSYVIPPWYRFPFMAGDDLQIGNLWTDPRFRCHGLASNAVNRICRRFGSNHNLWYITAVDNPTSRRIAEKSQFVNVGSGYRSSPCGLSLLGRFHITKRSIPS